MEFFGVEGRCVEGANASTHILSAVAYISGHRMHALELARVTATGMSNPPTDVH